MPFEKIKKYLIPLIIRIKLVDKIHYISALIMAIGEYFWKRLKNQSPSILLTLLKHSQWHVYTARYGKFYLFLTLEQILHGLSDIHRESDIPLDKIRQNQIVCDIGAHIGTHTLKMADQVGHQGKVIALEPDLKNFGYLCLNIDYNKFENVIPIRAALASESGKKRLYDVGKSAQSTLFSLERTSDSFKEIEAIQFKQIFEIAKVDTIDFMKMDIEGAEEKLILSEIETWSQKRIKILYVDPHNGVNYDLITEHLSHFGYSRQKTQRGYLFCL